jgi:hypothetical protein
LRRPLEQSLARKLGLLMKSEAGAAIPRLPVTPPERRRPLPTKAESLFCG